MCVIQLSTSDVIFGCVGFGAGFTARIFLYEAGVTNIIPVAATQGQSETGCTLVGAVIAAPFSRSKRGPNWT